MSDEVPKSAIKTKPKRMTPKPKPPKVEEITRTPGEWCELLGNYVSLKRMLGGPQKVPTSEHNAAKNLHGWTRYEHHAGEPMQITQKAYIAALKAVSSTPLTPHSQALSKY